MACTPCYTADIATFDILFPELTPVDDATVQFYLDKYDCTLNDASWGCGKPEAQLYLTAHMIALSQQRIANTQASAGGEVITSGGAGAITSASAGAISVGYAPTITQTQGSAADTYYTTTPYGLYFLSLKRAYMPLGILASCQ